MLTAYTVKSAPSIAVLPPPPPRRHQLSANTGHTMPTFSKASEGVEGVPVWTFTTIKNMQEAISSYREKLEASEASPYLIFRLVTTDNLLKIDRARENRKMSRGVRMTHYVDWDILIVKVLTIEHEIAHRSFGGELVIEAVGMGLRRELVNLGATTFKTPRVSKEGDSAYKPLSMRPRKADWPTIVLESGSSLTRLRQDAHIWLENSRGDVKIVLLFSISRTARTMIIEKWENRPVPANPPVPANRPATRSTTRAGRKPSQPTTTNSDTNTGNYD